MDFSGINQSLIDPECLRMTEYSNKLSMNFKGKWLSVSFMLGFVCIFFPVMARRMNIFLKQGWFVFFSFFKSFPCLFILGKQCAVLLYNLL